MANYDQTIDSIEQYVASIVDLINELPIKFSIKQHIESQLGALVEEAQDALALAPVDWE